MSVIDVSKWYQGVLFNAPSVYVVWNSVSFEKREPEIVHKIRKPKANEKFIVVSQTCDIKAENDVEPYIEVLLCTPNDVSKEKTREYLQRIDRNSARKFVIDLNVGLVAEAKYRG